MHNLKFVLPLIVFCNLAMAQLEPVNLALSAPNVEDVLVGDDGLLWVGTTEGLNVFYDDESHVFYSKIEDSLSLLNSGIKDLFITKNNNVFALTRGGLNVYNQKGFSFQRIPMESTPTGAWENPLGTIWVSTAQTGIYVLDSSLKIQDHFVFDPLNPLSISTSRFEGFNTAQLYYTDKKTLIATANGLNIYNNSLNTFKRYFKGNKTKFTTNNILGILPIDQESVGIITENELVRYNLKEDQFEVIKKWQKTVTALNTIAANKLLLSQEKQYSVLSVERGTLSHKNLNLNTPNLNKLTTAANTFYLWEKGGQQLLELDTAGKLKNQFTVPENINAVVYSSANDEVLIATNNGVQKRSKKTAKVLPFVASEGSVYFINEKNHYVNISDNSIETGTVNELKLTADFSRRYPRDFSSATFEYNHPYVVIAGENVSLFDTEKKQLYNSVISTQALKGAAITRVKNIDDVLYLSTENGILQVPFDALVTNLKTPLQEDAVTYYEYNELLNNKVPKGFEDIEKVGELFFVSDPQQGLLLYENTLTNFIRNFNYNGDASTTLASSTPAKLFYDTTTNTLFIGTIGSGLFKYDLTEKRFSKLDVNDGLLSNNIFDFAQVNDLLLLQTGSGVNYIEDGTIKNLNQEDGLSITNYHRESIHSVGDKILFTGNDKFQYLPIIALNSAQESFEINLLNVVALDKANEETRLSVAENNQLNFDYKSNTLIFDLYPNTSYKKDQIVYYFQRGENQAIPNGTNNKIQLSAFPYYESTVEIFAVNGNGQRSANTLRYTINNAPPWWLRVESIALYVILSIVIVYSLVKFRERQTKKKMEGERKNKELEEARQLQMSLLPKTNPEIKGLDISTYLKSATEIGGDYYDFFYKKDDYFYAICGDATGHGVISGIMVSVTKAGLNGVPMGTPSNILGQLNRIVKRVNFGRLRMSLSVVKFNDKSIELSSAAMPPTYYYQAKNNTLEEILVPNLPLGGIESEKFDGVKKDFNEGDILVMISDGLPELPNPQNQMLDYEKVHQCVASNADKDAESIKNALVTLSDEWAQGVMNPDDITIVVIKKAA